MDECLLEVDEVTKSFGGVRALDGISLGLDRQRITFLIGPNGAGKTTLFNILTGHIEPDRGTISYRKKPLIGLSPHHRARAGLGYLFQDVRVFERMTVMENVCVAAKQHPGERAWRCLLWPWGLSAFEKQNRQSAIEALDLVGLADRADSLAGELSLGQQKLLAIARLLNNGADCLLLDEPTAGVHPDMVEPILDRILELKQLGKTVVAIEHDLDVVRRVGDWVFVLESGRLELFGTPSEVLFDRDSLLHRADRSGQRVPCEEARQ